MGYTLSLPPHPDQPGGDEVYGVPSSGFGDLGSDPGSATCCWAALGKYLTLLSLSFLTYTSRVTMPPTTGRCED